MPTCDHCALEIPAADLEKSTRRCQACWRARLRRAYAELLVATSHRVVRTEFGWCTALCIHGDPHEWLCTHIHGSEEGASACLSGRV